MAVPAVTPVTTPDELTVALAVLLLLHAPPVTVALRAMLLPAQTVVAPEMVPAEGVLFTVTFIVATAVPQLLVAA